MTRKSVVAVLVVVVLAGCGAAVSDGDGTTGVEESTPTATQTTGSATVETGGTVTSTVTSSGPAPGDAAADLSRERSGSGTSEEPADVASGSASDRGEPVRTTESTTPGAGGSTTLAQDRMEVRAATAGRSVVLTVRANTSMAYADRETENPGEPLLVVLHEGRQLVRTDLERGPNTAVEVVIPADDFPAGVRGGRTEVTVRLLDRDSLFDDLLATWTGSVDVPAPETTAGGEESPATATTTTRVPSTATTEAATTTTTTTTEAATAGTTTVATATGTATTAESTARRLGGAAEF
ncbi:hypothetical protein ACFO0N_15525 [Halobium salinum]|uniref:Uncharacterized protein n=1 Tax=Halobium salinum TaxID=1364940 RepID=A0ABD5PFA9_9EURY|nr:hypothetical protein [Halobium salinum]